MDEKNKTREMRADAPKSTTYQLVEFLLENGNRVWTLQLTAPDEALIDEIVSILNKYR